MPGSSSISTNKSASCQRWCARPPTPPPPTHPPAPPPGDTAPQAARPAELLQDFGYGAENHAVPADLVRACGMASITNLIVRRHYGPAGSGRPIALNPPGDLGPPGEGRTHHPSHPHTTHHPT